MRFLKGVLYAGLASAILFAVSAPAKAGPVNVYSDTSINGTATVIGESSGAIVETSGATLLTVNGAAPSPTLTLGIGSFIMDYVKVGDVDMITGGTGTKIITDTSGNSVRIELSITSGVAMSGYLAVDLKITSVTDFGGNGLPDNYNFHTLLGGLTTITINESGTNFQNILGHPGAKSTPSLMTVTESIPEPTSVALLGIGMAGFFTYRRLFKRPATA